MAVLIQELMGNLHEDRWIYPDVAGVARAYNFYPEEGCRPDQGIAMLALGLGSTVVDGGACTRITPHPSAPKTTKISKNSELQTSFLALDMSLRFREDKSLVEHPLTLAEQHGTFQAVGGMRNTTDPTMPVIPFSWKSPNEEAAEGSPEEQAPLSLSQSVHGEKVEFAPEFAQGKARTVGQIAGPSDAYEKVVCLDSVLAAKDLSLRQLLGKLLEVGTEGFECPVEIEWALNLAKNPGELHDFVVLQTRPMSMWKRDSHMGIERDALPSPEHAIFSSRRALGNGELSRVHDVVFVHPMDFPSDPAELRKIASQIGEFNAALRDEKRGFLLVCPGRFGTSREGMGIPVTWPDINGTKCICETDIKGVDVPPSEGTHFFQNIASFGIGYVTVYAKDEGHVEYDWLAQNTHEKKGVVQLATFQEPLEVVIDGMTGCAVAMKPDFSFSTVVAQSAAFMSMNSGQYSSSL